MSRYSLVRALLATLVVALVWTTVTPAEAKRARRHSNPFAVDWTNCRNGAKLTISADNDVRVVITSKGRTLVRTVVPLRPHPNTIWVFNDVPDLGVPVIDNPDTDPGASDAVHGNEVRPTSLDEPELQMRERAATVKLFWRRPTGQTLNLGLATVDEDSLVFGTYRVDKCVLFPSTWSQSVDALTSFLWQRFDLALGRQ